MMDWFHRTFSSEGVIAIGGCDVTLFDGGEIHKVRRSMHLVVELFGVGQVEFVLHLRVVAHAHEVVVPRTRGRHHEKAKELVRQQHLHALVVRRQVALRVVASILFDHKQNQLVILLITS